MLDQHIKQTSTTSWWDGCGNEPETGDRAFYDAIRQIARPVYLVGKAGQRAASNSGVAHLGMDSPRNESGKPLLAYAPPVMPEAFGDPVFKADHGLRYAYLAGAMANGITSVKMVSKMGRAGMMGFFGAAGLALSEIERAIHDLKSSLGDNPFGLNLIHSPYDPALEAGTVDMYLAHNIRRISAAAFMDITLPLVRYRLAGIHRNGQGDVVCPNRVIAKVSRIEVAEKFFSPPPEKHLSELLRQGIITQEAAALAANIPVADDLTAEADSGGHTDNRPAISLLPTLLALRDTLSEKHHYKRPLCVGLGGGIATPAAAAAAFAMGAAYVLTGTINQACVEAGTSDTVRQMLAEARQADVIMAPAADMFEMGIKVQVLKRGTMFPLRAAKLYELYCSCDSVDQIPASHRAVLERDYFRQSIDSEWEQTRQFFDIRDPKQLDRAASDEKHKLALLFRSYLGQSSMWAKSGDPSRKIDYQIWCGPAIGAFNEWTSGSFLEKPENRRVVTVAMNLLAGASVITRNNWLTAQGITLPPKAHRFAPMPLEDLQCLLEQ
ncbi:MAG: PfaD family polyunsaturated fatty acid/polyketide biosynthesis protein [Deltaproteobacteria bacterium]|nr:PfaD family polyunsaturated fatty acid/polyketide biosynthesis protein [Deltaproteobacteria bacterium]